EVVVQALVDDQVLDRQLGEGAPHLFEVVQLALGPLADVAHLALTGVLDLAARSRGRALGLELCHVGLEGLGALLQVGGALALDRLALDVHLGLERGHLVVPELFVDRGDDVGGEVDDLLEILRRQVQQVAQPARHTLEVPDVGHRSGELDVAHPLTPDLGPGDLDTAALTDDALEAHPLVLAAVALPVPGGTEDLLAEQAVLLRLERAVVCRVRLLDLAVGPVADGLGGRQAYPEFVEEVDGEHVTSFPRVRDTGPAPSSRAPTANMEIGRRRRGRCVHRSRRRPPSSRWRRAWRSRSWPG